MPNNKKKKRDIPKLILEYTTQKARQDQSHLWGLEVNKDLQARKETKVQSSKGENWNR